MLADRTRPQHQRPALAQFSKNAFRQFHPRGCHGHWPRAKLRFRAHALPDFQRTLEETIQHGPCRTLLVRETIRFPHLSQDLRFAQHHRVEARGNSKEMPHGLVIVVVIERHAEDIRPHRMELAQKSRKSRGTLMGGFRRHAVHLAAIACREHQRLFEDPPRAQFFSGPPGLLGRERHPLTYLDGRGAVIQSDKNNFHTEVRSLLKVAVAMREV